MSLPHLYEVIADSIRMDIEAGRLKPGDKLGNLKELQTQYNTSYGTIRSALLVLKAQKIIYGMQGIGCFVADQDYM